MGAGALTAALITFNPVSSVEEGPSTVASRAITQFTDHAPQYRPDSGSVNNWHLVTFATTNY